MIDTQESARESILTKEYLDKRLLPRPRCSSALSCCSSSSPDARYRRSKRRWAVRPLAQALFEELYEPLHALGPRIEHLATVPLFDI